MFCSISFALFLSPKFSNVETRVNEHSELLTRSKRVQPTRVGLLLHTAAQIVLTPPAPRNGGPFQPFLGRPAKWTRWLAGAAAIKSV